MKRNILFASLIVLALSSCTVYNEYPIEIFKPGEVALSPDAKNVAIIYRNFKYNADTLQHYYKDDYRLRKARKRIKNHDSILVSFTLKELAKNLKSKGVFNEVKILPGNLFKSHSGEKLPVLSREIVSKIAASTKSDVIISLETYSSFFSKYSGQYDLPKSHEVITVAAWAVYDPGENKLIERKSMIDTLFWNSYDAQGNYVKNAQLPPRETALQIAAQMTGENYAKRFFATWQTVNRMYSVPPLPDFSEAAYYVNEGKWDQAINLWKKYADKKNGKLAINARYNLALGYEMKDDILTASKWLAAAKQLAMDYKSKEDLKMILTYEKAINIRKRDIVRLNQN